VVLRFIAMSGKRIAVTAAGFVLLLTGIVMTVTPGPGILLIIAGLAVLATEYVWAERLLNLAKQKAVQAKDTITRRIEAGQMRTTGIGRLRKQARFGVGYNDRATRCADELDKTGWRGSCWRMTMCPSRSTGDDRRVGGLRSSRDQQVVRS